MVSFLDQLNDIHLVANLIKTIAHGNGIEGED